jgi:hypothetical protein
LSPDRPRGPGLDQNPLVASYVVNERAVARARRLLRGRQYVLNSDWGDGQQNAEDENACAITAPLSGGTRRSSSQLTISCRSWTNPAPDAKVVFSICKP